MANFIDPYDPTFYAQEALIQLEPKLGIANRVYRRLDTEPRQRGQTIQVRRPGSFTAEDMPGTAQDLAPEMIDVKLDQHKGVVFSITDKELSYTREQMINEHIRPAAVAVARAIDLSLVELYTSIPYIFNGAGAPSDLADIAALWRTMFDNEVPEDNMHLVMNGERWEKFLNITAFTQFQGGGQAAVDTQRTGMLEQKLGFSLAAQQSIQLHTSASPVVLGGSAQLNAGYAKGIDTIVVKDSTVSLTGSVAVGDTFIIAGDTTRYAIKTPANAGGNNITLNFEPALVKAYLINDVVTFDQPHNKYMNLAFHSNFAALAMGSLTEIGDGRGAEISTIKDPKTNLSIRSTVWYDANTQENKVRIDALWGRKLLDGKLAVRYQI